MKARISPTNKLTNTQKAAAADYVRQQQEGVTRRIFKLMIVSLNELYGFGKGRSAELLHRVTELAEDKSDDPVFWTHIDRRCHQIGFNFKDEDWKEGFS